MLDEFELYSVGEYVRTYVCMYACVSMCVSVLCGWGSYQIACVLVHCSRKPRKIFGKSSITTL